MNKASDLIPWKVTDISLRPFKGMWSMNPSIHFDGKLWRCVLRCTDYAMPGGVTIRSDKAKPGQSRTKNAMVIFDPRSWKAAEIYKMREQDDLSRASSGSVGYEDIRIFRTDSDGLQGIAAALHLKRSDRGKQVAEQVLLSFDDRYDIVEAQPIRGAWSATSQKNWVPFDHCESPRFLYSIDKGTMFDDRGELSARDARAWLSTRVRRSNGPDDEEVQRAQERAEEVEHNRAREVKRRENTRDRRKRPPPQKTPDTATGGHDGLRGGSQLVRVGDDAWLGIGHAMKFVDKLKYYWHVWYLVDSRGQMQSASEPMKLSPNNGIEFAAGMAVDGERVVVSFGVDDMECRLGETKLSAVMEILRPVREAP